MHWQFLSSPAPSAISSSSSGPSKPLIATVSRWDTILQDEERYQAQNYPTPDDLPGCMTLMDEFFMCYALVPQMRNLYRHGEARDCWWRWRDFKYCLSLKSESLENRRELWIKRRAEWWAKRRIEGSSEDVWELRKEPLENFPPLYPEEIPVEDEDVMK